MPRQQTVRQRKKNKNNTKQSPSSSSTTSPQQDESYFRNSILPRLRQSLNYVLPPLLGLLAAASYSRDGIAVGLFIFTIVLVLIALLVVFISILGEKDQTPVKIPSVHHADGTVTRRDQMTVFEHDKAIATNYGAELPALALAAAWMYMWVGSRSVVIVYCGYVFYRLFRHPLFRIHLWKEEHCPEFVRPFGAQPLFTEEEDSSHRVKEVVGRAALQKHLDDAPKGSLVILDASATWCAPCRQMAPVYANLSQQFPTATFLTCDVDVSQDIATDLSVTSIPSFIFFKDKEKLELLRGPSPQRLGEVIQGYI